MSGKIILLIIVFLIVLIFVELFYYYRFSDNIYVQGNRNENKIAITFDDGPANETLKIIEILKNEGVPATFFVLGKNIKKNPEIFKKLIKSGNEIGSHSYNHLKLNLKNKKKIGEEISSTDNLLEEFNVSTNLFRPPYGYLSFFLNSELRKSGKKVILFDVKSKDYKNKGTKHIIENVLKNVRNGSIISFHDYAEEIGEVKYTSEALKILIPELKKNYEIVTVSELIGFK
ncbi:MAG: polysaccharide deacetylase family protein [Nanoarchaeota archaeon]|nr:polysaccharide deacetylase family protein [Nanoarchaeota archaeon]